MSLASLYNSCTVFLITFLSKCLLIFNIDEEQASSSYFQWQVLSDGK